jgi:simple sugar transport system substrate-binding protein
MKQLSLRLTVLLWLVLLVACQTEQPLTDAPTNVPVQATEAPSVEPTLESEEMIIGQILVGPCNDRGWSQNHCEAAEYIQEQFPGTEFIQVDNVWQGNPERPSFDAIVDDMVDQGAVLILATSSDHQTGVREAAVRHPDVKFVHISGQDAFRAEHDDEFAATHPANLAGMIPRFYQAKFVAGCAAGLATRTGKIGVVGPLISDETRQAENAFFRGAQYCWEQYRGQNPSDLTFQVTWIGFWFHIPGTTLDPTQVANTYIDDGFDVLDNALDTTEALVVAGQRSTAESPVWAVPQDHSSACEAAPQVCLGVPHYNWQRPYADLVTAFMEGTFAPTHTWYEANWADMDNALTSPAGWVHGEALTQDQKAQLEEFIAGIGDGSIDLLAGPLNYQDGTEFIPAGRSATDEELWYTQQLLEGMIGTSQ